MLNTIPVVLCHINSLQTIFNNYSNNKMINRMKKNIFFAAFLSVFTFTFMNAQNLSVGLRVGSSWQNVLSNDITALDFNALIPVWAVIFAWVTVSLILLAMRGRGLYMWPTRPRFMYGFMMVLLTFGVTRNIPVWPLTILFP